MNVYIRHPNCLPVTLNKIAKDSHYIQLEVSPRFYTPKLYIHPNQVSIQIDKNKPPFSNNYVYVYAFWMKHWLTRKIKLEMLLEVFSFKFVYIEKFFTQISLNWRVSKLPKKYLHLNSEHSAHWLISYHLWKFIVDPRTVSQ